MLVVNQRKKLVHCAYISVMFAILGFLPNMSYAQQLFIEIITKDVRFASTDDPVSISIGGIFSESLDDPDKDDRERGNTDTYVFSINDDRFNIDWLRGAGTLTIVKHDDSFWGGGWYLEGITIWLGSRSVAPVYQNTNIDKWLDGDDLSWSVEPNDTGWNLPEPSPPACETRGDIDTGEGGLIDSDCDGIADEIDPRFDPPIDTDGDGLPDRYEDQNGTNPRDPDSDDDGWWDGSVNRRTVLMLTKIEAIDEEEDIGSDEIYVVSEDVRFPKDYIWLMNDDSVMNTSVVIDVRVSDPTSPLNFRSRLKLRESDFEFFEKPTDDTLATFDLEWSGEEGTFIKTINGGGTLYDDYEYKLSFRWFTVKFSDPNPREIGGADADDDKDGLSDTLEFKISTQNNNLRPSNKSSVEGYDGLADPGHRELFVEIDAAGADHKMPYDAKLMVASQFYHHGISPRFDDGYFGNENGGILPHKEVITFSELAGYKNNNLWSERRGFFRYGLFVDRMEDGLDTGKNGRADKPGTKFMVTRTTMVGSFSAIVMIHEMGHTLGLCHPEGTKEPPIPSPSCPTPTSWVADSQHCIHYCGIDGDNVTAMGDDINFGWTGIIGGAATGAGAGIVIGGLVGGPVGAIIGGAVGGIIGGFIGGFLDSDAYARIVNYDMKEWDALILDVF